MAMLGPKFLLVFSINILFFKPILSQENDKNFSGYKLFQTEPKNNEDIILLNQINELYPEDMVNFWSDFKQDTVEILVHRDMARNMSNVLKQENITYRITINDFQRCDNSGPLPHPSACQRQKILILAEEMLLVLFQDKEKSHTP